MPAEVGSSAVRAATIEAAHAEAPKTTANHGPSQGREKGGGNRTESSEATTTRAPRLAVTTSQVGFRRRGRRRAVASASPTMAASAATSDQRPDRVHAPNAPEPGPARASGWCDRRGEPSPRWRRGRPARAPRPDIRLRTPARAPVSSTRDTSGVRSRRTTRRRGSPGGGRIGPRPSTSVRQAARSEGYRPGRVDRLGTGSLACAT
jgi:hypothetical protein